MNIEQEKHRKDPKFINRGSYGCTFRPGLSCSGNGSLTDKYITKVQINKDVSKNEQEISKKIKQIKDYEEYYAPVLSSCAVSLSTVSEREIEKCKILPNKKSELFEANKIRYVGENTLLKHLLSIYEKRPTSIVRKIVNSQMTLLDGFKKLSEQGIIHFDVKENNIICEDKTGKPIIIDFGISIDAKEIGKSDYKEAFYVYGPEYIPWCLEIAVIGYAANKIEETESKKESIVGFIGFGPETETTTKWTEQVVKPEQIDTIISDFFNKNHTMVELLTEPQRVAYRKKVQEYYNKQIGRKWIDVVTEVQQSKLTWDNYGVAVIYLYIIKYLKLDEWKEEISIMAEYKKYLEEILMSLPFERPTCEKTRMKMKELFGRMPRKENNIMNRKIRMVSMDRERAEKINKNVWGWIRKELLTEKQIYERKEQR
jgi:serine/threonine protein kinase